MAKIVTEFMHLKDRRMTAFRHLLSYPTKIVLTHNGQRGVFFMPNFTPTLIKSTPFITSLHCNGKGHSTFHSSYRLSIYAVISTVLLCVCGQIGTWL